MEKFDWNYFINCEDIIAVHCDTEEKAKRFCNLMYEHGLKWYNGTSYTKENFWEVYEDKTCYDNFGRFGNIDRYTKYNDIILDFDSFVFDEHDKSNEKNFTEVINAVKYLDRVKELREKVVKVSINNKLSECDSDCRDCLFDLCSDCTKGYVNWLIEPYHENLIKKEEPKINKSTKNFLKQCSLGCHIVRIKEEILIIDGENLPTSGIISKIKPEIFPSIYENLCNCIPYDDTIPVLELIREDK